MLETYKSYSPREWVLNNQPRRRGCEKLWDKISSIQKFPGYSDIDKATEIRKKFTKNIYDNYLDLNNYRGKWGEFVKRFDNDVAKIREEFKRFV